MILERCSRFCLPFSISLALRRNVASAQKAPDIYIRSMTEDDVYQVGDLGKKIKFNYPFESLKTWLKCDKDGIQVAVIKTGDTEEVIGAGAAINQDEKTSFLGTVCVDEEFREQGIAHKILAACKEHAGIRNLGLDCDISLVDYYKNRGFEVLDKALGSTQFLSRQQVDTGKLVQNLPAMVEIYRFNQVLSPCVYRYDTGVSGFNRSKLVYLSAKEKTTNTMVAMRKDSCVGYGQVKLNMLNLAKIGPLYADDPRIAKGLLRNLLMSMPEAGGISLATFHENKDAMEMYRDMNLTVKRQFLRMYSRRTLKLDMAKVYARFDENFSPI